MDLFDAMHAGGSDSPPTHTDRPVSAVNAIIADGFRRAFDSYHRDKSTAPLLLNGDALAVLRELPADSVDFIMTSPPYWGKREYDNGGIGLEATCQDFVSGLAAICSELKRILKPTGSFWLNLGDTYKAR